MEENIIKILLANDHTLFRTGVKKILEEKSPNIKVLGEAENFKQVLSILSEPNTFHILILDDVMPFGDPLETILSIKEKWPDLKIIVTGMYGASSPQFKPFMPYIDGLLSLAAGVEDYVKVIETVSKGGLHFYITGFDKKVKGESI